jgi:hypothetical protein
MIEDYSYEEIVKLYYSCQISLYDIKQNINKTDINKFIYALCASDGYDEDLFDLIFSSFPDENLFVFRSHISSNFYLSIDFIKKYLDKFVFESFKENKNYSEEEKLIIKSLYDSYVDLISNKDYIEYLDNRVFGTRIKVPMFDLISNPTIRFGEIKHRRFNLN